MKKRLSESYQLPTFLLFVLIFILLFCILFSISAYYFQNEKIRDTSIIEGSSPVVIIDAGHGGEDGGAIGKNGVFEKDINLKIAKKIFEKLSQLNINCVLTRETDILLYDRTQDYEGRKKALDMQARKRIAESYDNVIFISIHQNSFPEERYSGFQAYYSTNSSDSRVLATLIENSIRTSLQPNNRRASKASNGNIYLLDHLNCTSVLLECGFISNIEECELLCNEEYQNKLCNVISSTVFEFIKTSRA